MCTVLPPPGVNPIAVNKYTTSYRTIPLNNVKSADCVISRYDTVYSGKCHKTQIYYSSSMTLRHFFGGWGDMATTITFLHTFLFLATAFQQHIWSKSIFLQNNILSSTSRFSDGTSSSITFSHHFLGIRESSDRPTLPAHSRQRWIRKQSKCNYYKMIGHTGFELWGLSGCIYQILQA